MLAQTLKTARFDWDDGLLETTGILRCPVVSCYRVPFSALVAGKASDLSREIRFDAAYRSSLPVFRRPGGGCTVFLDPGCVIVSAAYPEKGIGNIQAQFERCTKWLIQGLERIGVSGVYKDGISDLVIDNYKIGGTCIWRSKDLVYFSAVMPVSCNLEKMDRYLYHPPREPDYRQGRSHTEFVVNLDMFSPGLSVNQVAAGLKKYLDPSI